MIKKSTIFALIMLSLFVCGLQMAAPVSAKLIDHGTHSYYDNDTHTTLKTTWKTYQYSKNYIIVKAKSYENNKLKDTMRITIKKISNKKLKLSAESYGKEKYSGGSMNYYTKYNIYMKYSQNARKYYYNELRPGLFQDSVMNSG